MGNRDGLAGRARVGGRDGGMHVAAAAAAADADIAEASPTHLVGIEEIAPVYDYRMLAAHRRAQSRRAQIAETLPVRDDDQPLAASRRVILIGTVRHGPIRGEHPPHSLHRPRIVGSHLCDSGLDQPGDDIECGGVANVVGVVFEGQTKHRDTLAAQAALAQFAQSEIEVFDGQVTLIGVDAHHRIEQVWAQTARLRHMRERAEVFAQAAPPIRQPGIEEGRPDAPVVAHTRRHLARSEEHTSELQSPVHLVCRLLLEKKKKQKTHKTKKKRTNIIRNTYKMSRQYQINNRYTSLLNRTTSH